MIIIAPNFSLGIEDHANTCVLSSGGGREGGFGACNRNASKKKDDRRPVLFFTPDLYNFHPGSRFAV